MFENPLNENYKPVVKIGNIGKDGKLNLSDIQYHLYSDDLNKHLLLPSDIVVAMTGATVGKVAEVNTSNLLVNQRVGVIRAKSQVVQKYILQLLCSNAFYDFCQSTAGGGAQGNISPKDILEYQIPFPPIAIQQEIVTEIEGYQKVINGARAVIDNYRPHIAISPDWEMIELGKICTLGAAITPNVNIDASLPYFGADSIESNTGKLLKIETAESQRVSGPVYEFSGERLLYSKIRPYLNKLSVVNMRGYCSSDMYPLVPDSSKIDIIYLSTYMLSDAFNERIRGYYERASIPKINRSQLFEVEIPVPPLEIQKAIVTEIEAEQALVNSNRELIERFEKKIQTVLNRIWGGD
jgi:restriction endonuclease S subunit